MKPNIMMQAIHGLAQLFYPECCEGCNNDLAGQEKILCLHCSMQLPRTGFHHIPENKTFRIFIGRVPIEKATSFVFFTKEGLMQHLLHRFKYKGKKEIGIHLGMLFAEELKRHSWLDDIDIIVPVPLYSGKAYKRGYNQTDMFAGGIASVSGTKICTNAIIRSKNTATQTRKSRAERVENVRDVFKLVKPELVKNKRILLVDDVLTTGATLEACALALLKAEGVQIAIATIALATD